jgi:NUMOD4 motif/HNH endonuclease
VDDCGTPELPFEAADEDGPERWEPIKGCPHYEISSLGRTRSIDHEVTAANRWGTFTTRRMRGRILNGQFDRKGYLVVTIYSVPGAAGRERRYVHQLVAEAFIGPCPPGEEVRHGPNGKLDNRASQLCYGTHSENMGPDMRRDGGHKFGSRDACGAGHRYTPETSYVRTWPDGSFRQRVCRICDNAAYERRKVRERENPPPPCTEDDCTDPQLARGRCNKHYKQWRKAKIKAAAEDAEAA